MTDAYFYRGIEIRQHAWGFGLWARKADDPHFVTNIGGYLWTQVSQPDLVVERLVGNWSTQLSSWVAMDRVPWAIHAIPDQGARRAAYYAFTASAVPP